MNTNAPRPNFSIVAQPTESTCGPTCLYAVYRHLGDNSSLEEVIDTIPENPDGGTYSVILANHALQRGYKATIYSYNLRVFDPTWRQLSREDLKEKLRQRLSQLTSKRGRANLSAYIAFLELGGTVRQDELTTDLLQSLLLQNHPIIAGLNSTHLYRNARVKRSGKDDDVHGEVEGHFVTLFGYNADSREVHVADPYRKNPLSDTHLYSVDVQRLINAIMLGIVTYDANLLVIEAPTPTKS
ncbi:C39 family peptidase [Pelagicoccus sp. SDUM812003]|uniref:C39 family peptidase n=1 Tax=Pelagicoccus sp. SDUM812003 TaxID=3041267 RepID=UPI00280F94B0|nr:C39 family peptidase [Pelagicoccus sp. SDUM812003]MDQ8201909.1 C39 family peptidase [Pelagicoccus sp. SDUM812003]